MFVSETSATHKFAIMAESGKGYSQGGPADGRTVPVTVYIIAEATPQLKINE